MPKIIFRSAEGELSTVSAMNGFTLMEAAVNNGIDGLEGECGGGVSCATCHVHIDPAFAAAVEPALANEIELLDALECRDDRSRLACQIKLVAALDGMVVDLPARQGF